MALLHPVTIQCCYLFPMPKNDEETELRDSFKTEMSNRVNFPEKYPALLPYGTEGQTYRVSGVEVTSGPEWGSCIVKVMLSRND